jgi:hypothetical protein
VLSSSVRIETVDLAPLQPLSVVGQPFQQQSNLLALQIEIKVIYNGFDVAARPLVVLAPLVRHCLVV